MTVRTYAAICRRGGANQCRSMLCRAKNSASRESRQCSNCSPDSTPFGVPSSDRGLRTALGEVPAMQSTSASSGNPVRNAGRSDLSRELRGQPLMPNVMCAFSADVAESIGEPQSDSNFAITHRFECLLRSACTSANASLLSPTTHRRASATWSVTEMLQALQYSSAWRGSSFESSATKAR